MSVSQRRSFLESLRKFMIDRCTPIERVPVFDRTPLDLHALYLAVTSRGGLQNVIDKKLWRYVVEELGVDRERTDAGFRLRLHYTKYLFPYEKKFFLKLTSAEAEAKADRAVVDSAASSSSYGRPLLKQPGRASRALSVAELDSGGRAAARRGVVNGKSRARPRSTNGANRSPPTTQQQQQQQQQQQHSLSSNTANHGIAKDASNNTNADSNNMNNKATRRTSSSSSHSTKANNGGGGVVGTRTSRRAKRRLASSNESSPPPSHSYNEDGAVSFTRRASSPAGVVDAASMEGAYVTLGNGMRATAVPPTSSALPASTYTLPSSHDTHAAAAATAQRRQPAAKRARRTRDQPPTKVTQQFCHLDYATLKRYLQLCGVRQPPAKSAAARLARQHFSATAIVNEEQTIANFLYRLKLEHL